MLKVLSVVFCILNSSGYSIAFNSDKSNYIIKDVKSCIKTDDSEEFSEQELTDRMYSDIKRKSFIELCSHVGVVPKYISDSEIESLITSFSITQDINSEKEGHCLFVNIFFSKKGFDRIRKNIGKQSVQVILGTERMTINIDRNDDEKIAFFIEILEDKKIKYQLKSISKDIIKFRVIGINSIGFLKYLEDADLKYSIQIDGSYKVW